ncbi:MAG: hypothetical protein ACTHMQ_04205 [Protaetiibacter sp.]
MATPTEHGAAAEAFFTRLTAPGLIPAGDAEHEIAIAHATLAGKAGTGSHYTAADALLSSIEDRWGWKTKQHTAQQATIHALLAD